MIIKIESTCELLPAILDEFKGNPKAIADMSAEVAKNAKAIATEAFEDSIGPVGECLKESNITLKVAVEFGNTDDFSDDLSERMTVEERNKARKLYANLCKYLSLCHEECICEALEGLEDIFGKELFGKGEG